VWVPGKRVLIGNNARLFSRRSDSLLSTPIDIVGRQHTIEFTLHIDGRRSTLYGSLYVPTNAPEGLKDIQLWYYGVGERVPTIDEIWPISGAYKL
jgi:hypothetical protein